MSTFYSRVRCYQLLISQLLVFACIFKAEAVEDYQLWLPREYYKYKQALDKAARIAENTNRCIYVIAGTVNLPKSTPDHPVFTLTCRDLNKKTFAWLIDGLNFEIVNSPEKNLSPVEKILAARRKDNEKYWAKCKEQLNQRTEKLKGLAWEMQGMPMPTDLEKGVRFSLSFSAAGKRGKPLNFIATCDRDDDLFNLQIAPVAEPPVPPLLPDAATNSPPLDTETLSAEDEALLEKCDNQLNDRLAAMTVEQRHVQNTSPLEGVANGRRFEIHFSAANAQGQLLNFNALCDVAPDSLSIQINPLAEKPAMPKGEIPKDK